MIIIIIKIKRPNGEALEILRRPKAGQQGGCGGAEPPRPTLAKRSRFSAARVGRPAGGCGRSPPPNDYDEN